MWGEAATVAHEVMQANTILYLGVEGFSSDGKLVIPTLWASCGSIDPGANTCEDPTTDPELSVWNQLQTELEQIKSGGTGAYYTPAVSQPTADTLEFAFIPSADGIPAPEPVTVALPGGGIGGEEISGAVSDWLEQHPEAVSAVGVRSVGEDKLRFGAVHGLLLDDDLRANLSNYDRLKLHTEVACGAYIQGKFNADGTVDTTKTGRISDPFRCYPREVLRLNNQLTQKIAYYTEGMGFISMTSVTAGVPEYTTPDNACWYRLENQYSYGDVALITVREKELKNRTFRDLILSPIRCRPTICFTGDSNTYGYGLSAVEKSWANLFIAQLATIGELTYGPFSKWVRNSGVIRYGETVNCKAGAYMELVTDAESVRLNIGSNYSSAWEWYVDGVTDATNNNAESIALDGGLHTVRVRFTGGQSVGPEFAVTKSITCVNKAVSGVSTGNMAVESGCDWLVVMIGTNHRNGGKNKLHMSLTEYSGRGSYILPVPTHRDEESHTMSLFQTIPPLTELFEAWGFEVINCVPELSAVFSDTGYLQGDKIHFTEAGHVIICNAVSAKMGLPTYLSIGQ